MNKRGLGKGLDALFGTPDTVREPVQEIAIDKLTPNQFQPRRVFDEEALAELAESIRQYGVLQPVVVRYTLNGYELGAGERRWRAAQMAGLKSIPAVIREYTDSEMTEIALIENLQRENLNPMEEAHAYRRLMDEFGLTQEEVAKKIGRSRSMIANVVRLLQLPPQLQDYVSRGTLTMGQVKPLLSIDNPAVQLEVANSIIENELSARDAEEMARRLSRAPKRQKKEKSDRREVFISDAEDRLKILLGTQVHIKPGHLKSKIEIEYYSADDLARIIEICSPVSAPGGSKVRGPIVV